MEPRTRSRLTNGNALFLEDVDARSRVARRQRDLERSFAAEIGGDLSVVQRIRIAQAAALAVRSEQLQSKIARGEPDVDDHRLAKVATALRRELIDLGLARGRM
jgi:glycosyltransferase A (GT-A) superfamily protein (DUF2064 family)